MYRLGLDPLKSRVGCGLTQFPGEFGLDLSLQHRHGRTNGGRKLNSNEGPKHALALCLFQPLTQGIERGLGSAQFDGIPRAMEPEFASQTAAPSSHLVSGHRIEAYIDEPDGLLWRCTRRP